VHILSAHALLEKKIRKSNEDIYYAKRDSERSKADVASWKEGDLEMKRMFA